VSASRRHTRGIYGFLFTIESAKYNPNELQERIMKFVSEALARVQEKQVEKFIEGLLTRKKEGFKDIKEECGYLFGQLRAFNTDPL
jgi:secreted Zn-dependent insulinase-like peptidase